jgi:hypothetical protein
MSAQATGVSAQTAQAAGTAAAYTQPSDVTRECPAPATGTFECMALVRNDLTPSMSGPVGGYGPADLQSAYNLAAAAASGGSGVTVALMEEGNDPDAVSDFNAYRAHYGLPACDETTEAGCLTTTTGPGEIPSADPAGTVQASMDADTIAAICPDCHVLFYESSQAYLVDDIYYVVNDDGARVVVLGYGEPDSNQNQNLLQGLPDAKGVAVVAAAGDDGYGTQFPASSQYVTAVGGTTLTRDAGSARGWDESVWAGTGAGCATDEIKPSWQTDTGCAGRTQNDVAADADPATGVAFYDSDGFGGWGEGGGTNVSAAIVAGVYALAGPPEAYTYPARYPYQASSGLYPVTSGSDGTCGTAYLCTAGSGYNGPAGLGTPDGTAAFTAPSGPFITMAVLQKGDFIAGQSVYGNTGTYEIYAWDSDKQSQSLAFSDTGLPPGLSLTTGCSTSGYQVCEVRIAGTPTTAGDYPMTLTATDSGGATSTITLPVEVQDHVTPEILYENATIGNTVSVPFSAASASGQALNFSATGLPPGISYTKTGPDQITFTGSPTTAGSYTTTVTVSNRYGGSATGTVTWTVHGTITMKPLSNLTTTIGGSGFAIASGTDSVAGTSLSYGWGNLPPGVFQDSPVGAPSVQGWPTTAGTYHVSAGASDRYGATAGETFTWTVTDSTATEASGPIRLDLGGKCLDDGTGVRIWNCNGTGSQNWALAQDGTIRGRGKCLAESGTANASRVVLATCTDSTAQRWQMQDETATSAEGWAGPTFVNAASGRCLGDPGGNKNGVYVEVLACNVGASKTWTSNAGPLESGIPGMCLADPANATANGTRLVLWQCNGWNEEKFAFDADGTIRIHGKCVYVNPNAGANSVAPAMLEACTSGNAGEQWAFYGANASGGTRYPWTFGLTLYNPRNGGDLGVRANTAANGTAVGTSRNGLDAGFTWRPV